VTDVKNDAAAPADSKVPFRTKLKARKRIRWCSCGLSAEQPFCDDSHVGTEFMPTLYRSEQDLTVALCGCKETRRPPFCDGSHIHKTGNDAAGRKLPDAPAS
jgi:CDGSH-type Zn-finger protein